MKKLEFLLQKEGDRAWLPLETPDVEILEGKYRVVARIQHPNTDIEIRIIHTSFDETAPQRKVQSRSARTNPEGLVVIIPYTRLKPGMWELSCLPDSKSEPAKSWQYGVQLEVLPAESETSEPLPAIDSSEAAAFPSASQNAAAVDRTPTQIPAPPPPPPQPTKIYQFPLPQTPQPPNPPVKLELELVLDRETFITQLGRPLIISGKIDIPQPPQKTRRTPPPIPESQLQELQKLIGSAQLQIYLRDPQTSQILAQIEQPMPEQAPPCIFACVTYIPPDCKSRLILGEAILSSGDVTLATKLFTITAGLEHLLEAIKDDFIEEKHQAEPSPTAVRPPRKEVHPSFLRVAQKSLDLPSPAEVAINESLSNESLPPQLNSRQTPSAGGLELPAFGNKLPDSSRSQLLSEITNSSRTSAGAIDQPTKPSDIATTPEKAEVRAIDQKPQNTPEPETPAPEPTPPPSQKAFQTLNVQNRFWSRLSSLASTGESPEWLKATSLSPTPKAAPNTSEAITVVEESSPTKVQPAIRETISQPQPTGPEAREFVVFDEPPQPKQVAQKTTKVEAEATPPTPYVLSEDESVPMPILELPRAQILAGQAVIVKVQLPELMPRIYVKVWVFDRQTYLILDGPRWITEFTATGLGNMRASIELEIPYGCMEIEFEAIAVEMQTQRESHKVSVHRQVLPPAAPTLPLEG
ncbi:MAG: hypothetical protein JGK38_01835 [Microcoleus sp. PH2017_15_JOR_U_A]|uniref:hypothetical protein n=1 Tax=Microcoleus sp. PH2017_15_JOR_U_A TaxID=2798826 RepID=UPI001D631C35|nr:hypothetical protein [Microcoleus sp. PH2017_15_JOR_U_A]MCC3495400.1 hypothetical protein [Microcoleus sp. PH2017_15_JOR_U_A]MCC3510628.1 hypothetical protein [Microcoleus sp. PH2017_17_BER_D_A]